MFTTAGELIAELQKHDPNTRVAVAHHGDWEGHNGTTCGYGGCENVAYAPVKVETETGWSVHLRKPSEQTPVEGVDVLVLSDGYFEIRHQSKYEYLHNRLLLPKHSHHTMGVPR